MKHLDAVNTLLEKLSGGLVGEDLAEFKTRALGAMGVSMETLCQSLEDGVDAGYSIEVQLDMVDKMIGRMQEANPHVETQRQAYATL